MRVRLKNADRKMKTILFIIQLTLKVKYYGLVLGKPELYHNMEDFTTIWGFRSFLSERRDRFSKIISNSNKKV
tara:strand:+ start:215 stop:433 length:219 start_codon:yes stop_codon:yes gene_type:complete